MPASKSRKGRKVGRNVKKCERYRLQGRRERNQLRKVSRHLRGHPNDGQALAWLTAKGVNSEG